MSLELPRLSGVPDRIFVSVDERTGRSTLSFDPASVGAPIPCENDGTGEQSLRAARLIAARHTDCTVVGPHFHTSSEKHRPRPRRPPR